MCGHSSAAVSVAHQHHIGRRVRNMPRHCPLLVNMLELVIAGAGGSSTLIALGTDGAVEAFCSGKAVLGDDFSLSLGAAPNPACPPDRLR